jgi:hypothetical protein
MTPPAAIVGRGSDIGHDSALFDLISDLHEAGAEMSVENVFNLSRIVTRLHDNIRPPSSSRIMVVINPYDRTIAHAANSGASRQIHVDTTMNDGLCQIATAPQIGSILQIPAVTPRDPLLGMITLNHVPHDGRV